jgi:nucleotide-binding universal stress UspA family protein
MTAMRRVLVAVDDSAPALAAAALAIEFAKAQPTELNFVSVAEPGTNADLILNHVAALADRAGVTAAITAMAGGQAFEALLRAAHQWEADVIVMGRSDVRRPGQRYVGSQTEHLLEFTDIPVLVVPEPGRREPAAEPAAEQRGSRGTERPRRTH